MPPARVGEDLHLDVARRQHRLLQVDGVVAERGERLAHRALERPLELLRRLDQAHPAAAAAVRRLHEQREAELRRGRGGGRGVAHRLGGIEHGNAGAPGDLPRARLVAGEPEHLRRRADEAHAGSLRAARQQRVLGQEAVARVDRVGADRDGQLDDPLRVEVVADRVAGLSDLVALVRLQTVHRVAILRHVDRDAAHAELVGSAERADRDLAAIGDEQRLDHRHARNMPAILSAARREGVRPPTARSLRRPSGQGSKLVA